MSYAMLSLRQPHHSSSSVFTEIFSQDVNLAVWDRSLCACVASFAENVLASSHLLSESRVVEVEEEQAPVLVDFAQGFKDLQGHREFQADVTWLMHAYSCLTGARRLGLRIRTLRKAMCPRYHVDAVSLRMISTYAGAGSQWLEEGQMDRKRLGDLTAEPTSLPQQLKTGSVAIFKGERWEGNEGRGIIHRSPSLEEGHGRLIMTVDWLK